MQKTGEWRDIHDDRVLDAFRRVQRSAFIPANLRHLAEQDSPLPIGYEQTISQPYVVAIMTQALALGPGETVLEIGTGSGFQTAILCELVHVAGGLLGETVYSIERFPDLAKQAAVTLHRLGYAPNLHIGDGALGWPDARGFDAILLTAAPDAVPRPLWAQLAEGGRMVIPVGPVGGEQQLWRLSKRNGRMLGTRLGAVRFVPLVSPILFKPEGRIELEP